MSSKPKKSQPRCHFVAIDPNKHPTNIQPQVYQVKNLVTWFLRLQDVLNILPEKNEGNRHVINVYTLDDCVSIMFSDEQVLKMIMSHICWLIIIDVINNF